jgi:hypothetical protein
MRSNYEQFARPRDDDRDDDQPRQPKKKGMSTGVILLIIFGSLGAVSCVVCIGVAALGYYGYVKAQEAMDDLNAKLPAGKGKVLLNQSAKLLMTDANKEFNNGFRRENKPHKAFNVQLEKGKTYVVTMASTEMDSFLFVYDPNGKMVGFDDDSGGGLTGRNSRMHLTADHNGNYQIACTVLGFVPPNGANFTVNVRER